MLRRIDFRSRPCNAAEFNLGLFRACCLSEHVVRVTFRRSTLPRAGVPTLAVWERRRSFAHGGCLGTIRRILPELEKAARKGYRGQRIGKFFY